MDLQVKIDEDNDSSSLTQISPHQDESNSSDHEKTNKITQHACPQKLKTAKANLFEDKENVRPNRSGRKVSCFNKSELQTQENLNAFKAEKYNLECKLRISENKDQKLEAYKNLINFYDNFEMSKTNKVRDLLYQIVKDRDIYEDEKFKNDTRYINFCLRIARDFCNFESSNSMIKFLDVQKIGTNNLDFYCFASQFYEEANDDKRAEKYYNLGLYKFPGHVRLLGNFKKFQKKVEGRGVDLIERGMASSTTSTQSKKSKGLKTNFTYKDNNSQGAKNARSNVKNDVYLDTSDSHETETENQKWQGHIPQKSDQKENQQIASKWTNQNLPKTFGINVPENNINVEVFEDVSVDTFRTENKGKNKRKVDKKLEKVLMKNKTGSSQSVVPSASKQRTTSKDPIYAYPKFKCNSGTEIFSLEELRLINPHQIAKIEERKYEEKLKNYKIKLQEDFEKKLEEERKEKEKLEKDSEKTKISELQKIIQNLQLKVNQKDSKMSEMSNHLKLEQATNYELREHINNLNIRLNDDGLTYEQRLATEREIEYTLLNFKNGNIGNIHEIELDGQTEMRIKDRSLVKNPTISQELAISGILDISVETKTKSADVSDEQPREQTAQETTKVSSGHTYHDGGLAFGNSGKVRTKSISLDISAIENAATLHAIPTPSTLKRNKLLTESEENLDDLLGYDKTNADFTHCGAPNEANNDFSIFQDEEGLEIPEGGDATQTQGTKGFAIFCDETTKIGDKSSRGNSNRRNLNATNTCTLKLNKTGIDNTNGMMTNFSIFKDDEIDQFAEEESAEIPIFADENEIDPKQKSNPRKSLFGQERESQGKSEKDSKSSLKNSSSKSKIPRKALGSLPVTKKLKKLDASLSGIHQLPDEDEKLDFNFNFDNDEKATQDEKAIPHLESTSYNNLTRIKNSSKKSINFSPIINDETRIVSSNKPPLADGTFTFKIGDVNTPKENRRKPRKSVFMATQESEEESEERKLPVSKEGLRRSRRNR